MKTLVIVLLAVIATASYGVTVSGTDLNPATNSLMRYGGSNSTNGGDGTSSAGYNSTSNCATLTISNATVNTDAVVGVAGPFGTLSNSSMSFTIQDESGSLTNEPFCAFGLDGNGDGIWNDGLLVIGMGGTTLDSASAIHVVGADQSYWGDTLASLYDQTYNGVKFGDMTILRAYVYIGDWNVTGGDKEADISSITVVPEPATMALLGLGALGFIRRKRAA